MKDARFTFNGIAPQGPDAIFSAGEMNELVEILERLRATAQAA